MHEVHDCAYVCLCCACADASECSKRCMGCAYDKACRTHIHWPKHVKHGQSRINPSKGTHLSPIQHKNVTRTFCQTPNMQQYIIPMKNS